MVGARSFYCWSARSERNKGVVVIRMIHMGEARRTTILQPVEQKPHSQKDRQDEKA